MSAGSSEGFGRSRMCPTDASTSKSPPRYPAIVFALAGDSTMTSLRPLPAAMTHLRLPGLTCSGFVAAPTRNRPDRNRCAAEVQPHPTGADACRRVPTRPDASRRVPPAPSGRRDDHEGAPAGGVRLALRVRQVALPHLRGGGEVVLGHPPLHVRVGVPEPVVRADVDGLDRFT